MEGATAFSDCVCPRGWFRNDSVGSDHRVCMPCGYGHFCKGDRHRQQCAEGSTTEAPHKAESADGCVCERGWQPLPNRSETERCTQCLPSMFKNAIGDEECLGKCSGSPLKSYSNVGAKDESDCYCNRGYFRIVDLNECAECGEQDVEVDCQDNVGPDGAHVMPVTVVDGEDGYLNEDFASKDLAD